MPDYYFELYSEDVVFFDTYKINTITKAIVSLLVTFVITCINVYVRRRLSAWQINYLNSPHVPRGDLDGDMLIHFTMIAYTLFLSLSSAVNIFLMFSNFWFLVSQTAATVFVTIRMTSRFLHEKNITDSSAFIDRDDQQIEMKSARTKDRMYRISPSIDEFNYRGGVIHL